MRRCFLRRWEKKRTLRPNIVLGRTRQLQPRPVFSNSSPVPEQHYWLYVTFAGDVEQAGVERRSAGPAAQLEAQGGGSASGVRAHRSGPKAGHDRQGRRAHQPGHHRPVQAGPVGTAVFLPGFWPRHRVRRLVGRRPADHRHRQQRRVRHRRYVPVS